MTDLDLPLIPAHQPTTFVERGVAVPFTQPILVGARVRMTAQALAEFILPNPAGGRGVYIVTWAGVRQLCRPTLHDALLQERLCRLATLSPGNVREAARRIAAEGYAGHAARDAAETTARTEAEAARSSRFLLLLSLMQQIAPNGLRIEAATQPSPALEERGRRSMMQAALRIGCTLETATRGLSALAHAFAPIGVQAHGATPKLPELLQRMGRLRRSVAAWSEPTAEDWALGLAQDIARSVQVAANCGEILLRDARALTTDVLGLLHAWLTAPLETLQRIERLDWLLDGWDRLCRLWEAAQPDGYRRAALLEMAQMVPILPREIADWVRLALDPAALQPACRVISLDDSWRTGSAVFGLIARNERLRAMGA